MRIGHLIAPLTAATVAVITLGHAAHADLVINIDKSAQRMIVTVNGEQLYDWPVSSGGSGYDTPSGTFKPFRMEIDHYSDEWDNAPMPYSIFFTKIGHAIHGTYAQRNLGQAVSHGCVRLSVKNAATLWKLVKQEKMANTTVVLSGATQDARPVMGRRPMPLNPDDVATYPPVIHLNLGR
jgi:lipoprotein-anchoring transpeptidase ErfK/SrfK